MTGHANTVGDRSFMKKKYTANKSRGEKAISAEFEMTFSGFEDMTVLIRTTQLPEMTREDVEDFGPNGMKFNQHGPLRNSGEITVQCVETIGGDVCQFIKDRIAAKDYVDIVITTTPESRSGATVSATTSKLMDCKIYCDAVDLSTEDVTSLIRPSLRIVYNWIDY